MTDEYTTIAGETRCEPPKIKGSRFIATARPLPGGDAALEEIEALVTRLRAEFPDANHHGSAYRLGAEGETSRADDDGEPSGSAGRPILARIEGAGLTQVVVVVTRIFGGTKLGVGGLVRAYGGAAAAVLDEATRKRVVVTRRVEVEYPYTCSGAVQSLLSAMDLAASRADYGASVRQAFDVPASRVEQFLAELGERTAGRARARTGD